MTKGLEKKELFSMTVNNTDEWSNPQFWTDLCPNLHITNNATTQEKEQPLKHVEKELEEDRKLAPNNSHNSNNSERTRIQQCLIRDGYALIDFPDDDTKSEFLELISQLRHTIARLDTYHGVSPTFVLLFDETWRFFELADRCLLAPHTHPSNRFNFDTLAWCIDPARHQSGFSPHRDRQPVSIASSFHRDGQAKYVTLWTALSEATPENSCLYMIPKHRDPGYMNGDDDEEDNDTPDPLRVALPNKHAYQDIRAIPLQPGQSVLFTHRILHWGSRGNPDSSRKYHSDNGDKNNRNGNPPRVAISLVCSDPTFEAPYLVTKAKSEQSSLSFTIPPFRVRLLLVCAQLLIYYQRLDLSRQTIRACYEYIQKHDKAGALEPAYRQKVMVEFVKAMKEAKTAAAATVATTKARKDREGDDDEEEEDAMLEEMLNAEQEGYGEFQDDFDALQGDDLNGDGEDDLGGDGHIQDGESDDDEEGVQSLFGTKRKLEPDEKHDEEKRASRL